MTAGESWVWLPLASVVGQATGHITPGPSPSRIRTIPHQNDSDVPVIVPGCITGTNKIIPDAARFVLKSAAQHLGRFAVKAGDVIIVRQGAIGRAAVADSVHEGWLISPACAVISLGTDGQVRPDYLVAYLTHPQVTNWLLARAVGQTVPNITINRLLELPVLVPPQRVQQGIAEVATTVDTQMARHERAIDLLAALRQRQTAEFFDGRLENLALPKTADAHTS